MRGLRTALLRLLPHALEGPTAAGRAATGAAAPLACGGPLPGAPKPLVSLRDYRSLRAFAASGAVQSGEGAHAAAAGGAGGGDDLLLPPVYSRLEGGGVAGAYTVARKAVFAVVEVGGTQYKVTPDDVIVTEKLGGVDVNDRLTLSRVLVLGSAGETVIGRPYIPGAAVTAAVEVRRRRAGRR